MEKRSATAQQSTTATPSVIEHHKNVAHTTGMSLSESLPPKSVAFELLFTQSSQHRARIPMRVQIFPHDTTDSIVTTVKNFYGLYPTPNCAKGVSFEDEDGNTLIARYENFQNNMVIYVRVINEPVPHTESQDSSECQTGSLTPQITHFVGESHQMPPPEPAQDFSYSPSLSRPNSRTSRQRSPSPNHGRSRRSASTNTNPPQTKKNRGQNGPKSRGLNIHNRWTEYQNEFSSGHFAGDEHSTFTSNRNKSEHIGSTEISLDNIVEGGRRKRAKFESSELPLFAPPQMPAAASNSSISPSRRIDSQRSVIYTPSNPQHPFSNPQPLHSPKSSSNGLKHTTTYPTPATENRRTRGDISSRQSLNSTPSCNSSSIIPTPDPTVGSCMSEEDRDVAIQLMRLGEFSTSTHGRTSASTLDDNFSGKADATSSTGIASDCESELRLEIPLGNRVKREESLSLPLNITKRYRPHQTDTLPSQESPELSCDDIEYEDIEDETFRLGAKGNSSDADHQIRHVTSKGKSHVTSSSKLRTGTSTSKTFKSSRSKVQKASHSKVKKPVNMSYGKPISPDSLPTQSRKTSNASTTNLPFSVGGEEEDLSSKPRCQRCRKSKKGCDRQRPCQRCKDAGLSADQCVSEDEGNGRKGRYGRHMGVPVRKDETGVNSDLQPATHVVRGQGSPSKKRKR
ncbi:C6 finger domain protein [Blumeria hordei DH14]|uniref:C6 finger domain protein n=1 Tax=Blumeria graminis f. sp. hordei (strain DH14) TaxID=546991 RepID=N1JMC3_BLUG1|nr:C6 finger domain protein [Blumeria hordei DH14]